MSTKNRSKTSQIIFFGNSNLRIKCTPVTVFHKGLHEKIDIIRNTLKKNGSGAALAAPQISLSKQIIVVNYLGEYFELINPEIIETHGKNLDFEGCLSLPKYVGKVNRYEKIQVKYQDRYGKFKFIDVANEMARCFQHEIDHLNGVLYIDRVIGKYVYNNDTNEKIRVEELLDLTRSGTSHNIG